MLENLTTTEKVTIEIIVMREAAMDAVRIMDLMVANNARTVLRSTLDLIIMEATASSVEVMAITIMAVSNVLMAIVRMEIMKEENVLTVHHVSITMVENASSARLLQDIIMRVVSNSASSVLVRDNSRVDIVSRAVDMETTVREVSVSVQPIIIHMQNIA